MTLLSVQQVSKSFTFYDSPIDRLKERLLGGERSHRHQALHDINLSIQPGESVGLLGKNGAGKSTLLKLITGVLMPDTGHIHRTGRITGLLELGTGFDPNLSGRDNIRINGVLLGMDEAELAQATPDIIDFAELGEYIDHPVRTYSSGMAMRLGFAIAIHANPACFIVDEALAVGDARFQQKCIARIKAFQQQGGALLFVSHDLNTVKMLCQRAIVLDQGHIACDGDPNEAAGVYYQLLTQSATGDQHTQPDSQQVRIRQVAFYTPDNQPLAHLQPQQICRLCFDIQADIAAQLTLGFMIKDRFGQEVFGTNTHLLQQPLSFEAGQHYRACFDLTCTLGPGEYTLSASLHAGSDHTQGCQHWLDHALSFQVHAWPQYPYVGLAVQPVHSVTLSAQEPPHDPAA